MIKLVFLQKAKYIIVIERKKNSIQTITQRTFSSFGYFHGYNNHHFQCLIFFLFTCSWFFLVFIYSFILKCSWTIIVLETKNCLSEYFLGNIYIYETRKWNKYFSFSQFSLTLNLRYYTTFHWKVQEIGQNICVEHYF